VAEPKDLRSVNGTLKVDLTVRSSVDAAGHVRYCYLAKDGSEAPNVRVKPGDWLILSLKNEIETPSRAAGRSMAMDMSISGKPIPGACTRLDMTAASTNLHFHGLTVPPVCHQDDVLKTIVQPGDAPYEYRFQIPPDEVPGLYWYHPHVHGFTSPQVLGGASGALIVEGIERANRHLAGLPERVFVIRDQDLLNPGAQPVQSDSMPAPLVLRDAEGDILNTGTGTGKPAKDLGPIVNQSAVSDDTLAGPGSCGSSSTNTQGQCGYGPRLPLLVISPYAKQNYVDHVATDQSSILRFIEDNWSLGRIGGNSSDVKAGALNSLFDFSDKNRAPKLILDDSTGTILQQN
jgi:hypothetical protein